MKKFVEVFIERVGEGIHPYFAGEPECLGFYKIGTTIEEIEAEHGPCRIMFGEEIE